MSDIPTAVVFFPLGSSAPLYPGFEHRMVLIPIGVQLTDVYSTPTVSSVFLIDPDCAVQILNGLALAEYLKQEIPVLLCACRARDLRPFLRRSDAFRKRGYELHVIGEA